MKHLISIFLLALALYPIQVGIELLWHYAFLEGVKFTVRSDWLQIVTLVNIPPIIILYSTVGWICWRVHTRFGARNCLVLAVAVFAWGVTFRETIWYIDPTVADLVWHSVETLTPSVSIVLGGVLANLVANKSLNSDAGKAGAG